LPGWRITILTKRKASMQAALSYISNAFSTENVPTRTNAFSTENVPTRTDSPPRVRYRYDCQNFACVQDTGDLTSWKQLNIKKNQIYFCSEECYYEYLEIPSGIGSYSPDMEQVRRDGHVKLPEFNLDAQTHTDAVVEDKTSQENGSQKSSEISPGTAPIEPKK
jgi:hypothetical protein